MQNSKKYVICGIGAKGAIGTTIAAGARIFRMYPDKIENYLVTNIEDFPNIGPIEALDFTGWDISEIKYNQAYLKHRTFSYELYQEIKGDLDKIKIFSAPDPEMTVYEQIKTIKNDIKKIKEMYTDYYPVMVNLLPASDFGYEECQNMNLGELYELSGPRNCDLAYIISAIEEGIPFINFTSNPIELPAVIEISKKNGVPICGRDGKTGQTFFKILLASGLKARNLNITGWYSTNILGNNDGMTLNDPNKAKNKISNKSEVLDKTLGYRVDPHIVRIDYYLPRKDYKEAWDVIDFKGFLAEDMALRTNLQGKDSVLAAPLIIDMARILSLCHENNISGLVPELAFFFKNPLGENVAYKYEEQLSDMRKLIDSLGK